MGIGLNYREFVYLLITADLEIVTQKQDIIMFV